MNWTAAYGVLAHGLIFGALAGLLPVGPLRSRIALAATAVALVAGIAPTLHGIFGPPSLTLLQLALLQLAERPSLLTHRAASGFAALALPFYATVLGWGPFDPYALGYQPWALLAALVPVGAGLAWRRLDAWLLILAIDLAGYAAGLFANLWDALFDPLLAGLAAAVALRRLAIAAIASRRH